MCHFKSPPSQTAGHIECQPHRAATKLAVSVPRTGAYPPYPMSICSFRGIRKGFQGEASSRGIRIVVSFPDGLVCMVIHLAVELRAASEALITGVIVLVDLDMGKDSSEG
jgi:hypothetical protein